MGIKTVVGLAALAITVLGFLLIEISGEVASAPRAGATTVVVAAAATP